MADPDLIARIYPVQNNRAAQNFLEKNANRFRPGLDLPDYTGPSRSDRVLGQSDREPTQPLEDELGNPDDYIDCLELRFSKPPQSDRGFVFGRHEKCDVVFPSNLVSVSNYHFTVTFANNFEDTTEYRLVLRDLNSMSGTSVQYGGKGRHRRRGFRWILSEHPAPRDTELIIEVNPMLLLRIVVHIPHVREYLRARIAYFLRPRSPESQFVDLDLYNPPRTEAVTGLQTPASGPIVIDVAELGRGAFAVTKHCWDVSTGRAFARKQPKKPLGREDRAAWIREANLLDKLSHEHIVRIYELNEGPGNMIELHLELVHGGNLTPRLPLPYLQGVDVVRQCLAALAYLHGQKPSIVHRDIKPDNILVNDTPYGIHVKLADFGFSREDRDLITLCGTPLYFPPEIYEEEDWRLQGGAVRTYLPAVDIWSLGVVAAECIQNLPTPDERPTTGRWCTQVVKHIAATADDQADPTFSMFLLSHMVVLNPRARASAQQCHNEVASLLPRAKQRRDETRQSASAARSGNRQVSDGTRPRGGMGRLPTGLHADGDEQTVLPTIEEEQGRRAARTRRGGAHPYQPAESDRRSTLGSAASSQATITPRAMARREGMAVSGNNNNNRDGQYQQGGGQSGYFPAINWFTDPTGTRSELAWMLREAEAEGESSVVGRVAEPGAGGRRRGC